MVVLLGFMAAITLVMWLAPSSEAGRALHRQLFERPLEALSDLRRHHLIFFVIMVGFAIGGGEAIAIFGPEIIASYAIYLDAVMVTYALSAVAMAKRSSGWLMHKVMRMVGMRPRGKRAPRRPNRPRKPASNDDDPAPAVRYAA